MPHIEKGTSCHEGVVNASMRIEGPTEPYYVGENRGMIPDQRSMFLRSVLAADLHEPLQQHTTGLEDGDLSIGIQVSHMIGLPCPRLKPFAEHLVLT